jgi:transglutaminase-like putative cysteine protease
MRRVSNFIGPRLAPYVALPDKIPAIITRTARAVTDGASNEFDRVMALQTYLRGGQFTYSETAPVAEDYDGNGLDVLAVFLQKRSGYCVHFSSAMAVMARSLGIPARIAVGYAPGRVVSLTRGQNLYAVTNDDLHAWTEIYFSGIGWTRFDPTPGVGSAASFEEPGSASQAPLPPSQANGGDPQARGDDRVDSAPNASQDQTAPRSAIVVGAGILLVILAPGAVRLLLRRYRLRSRSPDQWWRELEASATDLGVETSLADTPRGFAGRLSARPGVDTDALHRLLDTIETTRFARPGSESGRTGSTDAQAVLHSLTDGASRRARLRAALLPRSLARAARPAPRVEPLGI